MAFKWKILIFLLTLTAVGVFLKLDFREWRQPDDRNVQFISPQDKNSRNNNPDGQNVQNNNIQDKHIQDNTTQYQNVMGKNSQDQNVQDKNSQDQNIHDKNSQDQNIKDKNLQNQNLKDKNVQEKSSQDKTPCGCQKCFSKDDKLLMNRLNPAIEPFLSANTKLTQDVFLWWKVSCQYISLSDVLPVNFFQVAPLSWSNKMMCLVGVSAATA